jgi:translation elongation factor EF-1beta
LGGGGGSGEGGKPSTGKVGLGQAKGLEGDFLKNFKAGERDALIVDVFPNGATLTNEEFEDLENSIKGLRIPDVSVSPGIEREEVGFGVSKLTVQLILSSEKVDTGHIQEEIRKLRSEKTGKNLVRSCEFRAFGKHPF